jgi:hypothetical protein
MKMTELQKMYHRARGRWSKNAGKEEARKQDFHKMRQDAEQTDEARGADSKGHYRSTDSGAGMTAKGVAATNRKTGGNLKTAVTGKVKPGSKDAKRRKSFCARMSGMKGPMKDDKGRPTRKAMSLKRWKC